MLKRRQRISKTIINFPGQPYSSEAILLEVEKVFFTVIQFWGYSRIQNKLGCILNILFEYVIFTYINFKN